MESEEKPNPKGASGKVEETRKIPTERGVETLLKDLTMEDKMDHKREDDEKAMRQTRMENTKYHKIHEIKNDEDMADIIDLGSTPRYTRSMKRKGKTSEQQPDAEKGKQKIDDDAGGIAKKAKVDEQVE